MYVIPQTVVKFYRDIPFTSDYKHTIWFRNVNAQNTFFASKLAYTYNDFTYVRQTGVIRVPRIADDLYNCNYISFLNAGYGNKTFYAFITKVDYVNNETTDISFQIDYIQTWLFDMTVEQCFVEREHVADDTVGLHTVDEKLETGEYLIESKDEWTSDANAVMLCYTDPTFATGVVGNIPSYSIIKGYTQSNYWYLNNIIQSLSETPEKVGYLKMACSDMIDGRVNPTTGEPYGLVKTFETTHMFARNTTVMFHNACTDETYIPKNNKLKCYPYCCFTVDNFNGDVIQYKWEEFSNPYGTVFVTKGTPCPVPVIECFPKNYKKNYNASDGNTKQFKCIFDNFPEIPFASDTFKIWSTNQFKKDIASTGASILTGSLSTAALITAGALAENPMLIAGGVVSGVSTMVNASKKAFDMNIDQQYHKLHDSTLTGSTGNAGVNWLDNEVGFRFTSYQIRAEYARIIDNFLTRFGYKVNVFKVPELTSRRYFNYVKTIDAGIKGNIPSDCQKLIASIFDSGITLWHTSDVGNYNVDNAIVG